MKLLTRTALFFLTAFVLVTAAHAWDVRYVVDGKYPDCLYLYFQRSTRTVTGCDKNVTKVVIPEKIDGVSVTSIYPDAFSDCISLTSVEIPDSVTSIGSSSFSGCTSLASVKMSNRLTSIGSLAFHGCTSLTSITIPDSVTSLGTAAFYDCTSLTSVKMSNRLTSIVSLAFCGCTSLTSITIPDSVTSIGNSAFYDCTSLTSVTIPDGVASIESYAFCGCTSLTNINAKSGNENYVSVGGILFDKSQTKLICYPAGKPDSSYKIPDSVTSIGESAFGGCASLTGVEIPDSVTCIGGGAFYRCTSLTNIHVQSGNENYVSVNGILFDKSQTKLICYPAGKPDSSYKIPKSVTSIGSSAFIGCASLTGVEIPDSVTSIETGTFYKCDNLRDVYYGGSPAQWEAISGISDSGLVSDNVTVHYNASMPEPPAPEFTVPSAPVVGGHAIMKADLSGLTEISVPVTVSAESAVSVTLCVPFFDGGKFLGMGFVTVTVDKTTQSVTVPVTGNVSGAGKLNVIFVDADFRPLSAAAFDIAA